MWMLIIVVLGVFFSLQSEAMVGMVVGHRDNEPHPVHGRNEAAAELAGEVDPGLSFDQRPVCCSRVLGVDVGLGNVGKAVARQSRDGAADHWAVADVHCLSRQTCSDADVESVQAHITT